MRLIGQINEEIEKVFNEYVDEDTGEILEGFEGAISKLTGEKEEVLTGLALKVKELTVFKKAAEAFYREYTEKAKKAGDAIDRIKAILFDEVKTMPDGKLKNVSVSCYYSHSNRIDIAEGAIIPEEYMITPAPYPNKEALAYALKNGAKIDGVTQGRTDYIIIK